MRIIIAGGREVTDYEHVRQGMMVSGYWKAFKHDIEVVCGMALSWKWGEDPLVGGADRLGYRFAENNGLTVKEFHADWKGYGKRAGHVRNAEMGRYALEDKGRLLALWDGVSEGTKGMIEWADKNGLEYYVHRVDKARLYLVTAPHFCAGFVAGDSFAPIIKYMADWPMEKIRSYCKQKGWKLELIE